MTLIASDLLTGTSQNLISFTTTAPPFTDANDLFGIVRGQVNVMPLALADDTVVQISNGGSGPAIPTDTLGIINSTILGPVLGVVDTLNPNTGSTAGTVSAIWQFDISGASNLSLAIDMAAMGDFESADDQFVWTYQIDGGASQTLFTSSVDEAATQRYRMENRNLVLLDHPLLMNGALLSNEFQTWSAPIAGVGSVLTLTLTANQDGGNEAFAARQIRITSDASGPSLTPIYTIQGAGHTSPLVGQTVTTAGIVTAIESNGFYLQDAVGDGSIATSDALFVFTGTSPSVAIGDFLQVTGSVTEFTPGGAGSGQLSTTQLAGGTTWTVVSTGNALPTAVVLGTGGRLLPAGLIDDDALGSFDPATDGLDFWESLEGMRVTAPNVQAIAPTNRFDEIFGVVDLGANATGLSDRGALTLSANDFNPERVQIDLDFDLLAGFPVPSVQVGDRLGNVTGIVSYDVGNFQLQPTQAFTVTPGTLTPEVTTLVTGGEQLILASYNVFNLDINDSDGDADVGDGRLAAIASQIVNNLGTPDIIALQEIQDNSGRTDNGTVAANQTLQALVAAIAAAGGPTYQWIDNTFISNNASGGEPGGNIRTAYLYNPSRVSLNPGSVQSIQVSGQATNPANPFFGSRLPLVASFTFRGETVTLVNTHLSAKNGSAPLFGTEQPVEARQEDPTVNGGLTSRQAQAQAINTYVSNLLAANSSARVVVLGDMNEFEFVSPLQTLETNLTNLAATLPEHERYTYIFEGNAQAIDHILVSNALRPGASLDIVHVNTEFAETPSRASDHDPLLVALSVTNISQPPVANGPVTARILENQGPTTVNLLAGASDANGDLLTVADFSYVSGNAAGVRRDGDSLRVTPAVYRSLAARRTTSITYSYTISDGQGGATPQTATVSIAGLPTLFWRNQVTGQNVAWFDANASNFATITGEFLPLERDLGWQQVGTGDFNGDQLTDIVWRHRDGRNVVWLMEGSTQIGGAFLPAEPNPDWEIQGVADFNNDGQDDLIWRNRTTGQNAVWYMNGTTRTSGAFLPTERDRNWQMVGVGNFDTDGITDDIVWRNQATGQNVVWLMEGTVRTGGELLPPVPDLRWTVQGVSDFNADGFDDLLWRQADTGVNAIWLMNGSTLTEGVFIRAEADRNWTLTV